MSAKSRQAAVRPLPKGDAERLWEEGVYAALRLTAAVSALAFRPDGRWLLSGPLEELYGAKSTMAPCYGIVATRLAPDPLFVQETWLGAANDLLDRSPVTRDLTPIPRGC